MPRSALHRLTAALSVATVFVATPLGAAEEELLRNPFHDPFLQLTHGMPTCPEPEEPLYTRQEYINLAHERSQRGVSCWLAGRCRLPNGYLYDAEIIPRVEIAVNERNRYDDTSVWALGQRRRVWLRGCVRSPEQAAEIEAIVRHIDDVEDVQNELMVGDKGQPRYVTKKK
jgi:BON domain-containing protein